MRMIRCLQQRVDELQASHEVIEGLAVVQEPSLARDDKFGNTRDGRRQHDFPARHRLHQHKRNAFAATGQDHYVGAIVQ